MNRNSFGRATSPKETPAKKKQAPNLQERKNSLFAYIMSDFCLLD